MKQNKTLKWLGNSLKNLGKFPAKVKDEIGQSLYEVQMGDIPHNAKALKGFNCNVMEIKSNFNTNTYRAVYVLKLDGVIYVLHCFQKKSKSGIKTALQDVNLIKQRLQMAKQLSKK